jgi:hypothetical protein
MPRLYLLYARQLPSPVIGYDWAVWHMKTGEATLDAMRRWAQWSATRLCVIAPDQATWVFLPDGQACAPEPGWPEGLDVYHPPSAWSLATVSERWLEYPEVGRLLAFSHVRLVIARFVSRPAEPYDSLWRLVQANQMFGVMWAPRPIAVVPCECDPDQKGYRLGVERDYGIAVELTEQEQARTAAQYPIFTGWRPAFYGRWPWWHK